MSLYHNILAILWAFFISVFAIPSIISVAHIKKLLDEPNLRTVHVSLTPRLGGLAIFAGFVSALTLFGRLQSGIRELLAGAIVIFFIGLKDDIIAVSAFKKFFVQVLAAGIILFLADIRITNMYGILGMYTLDTGLSYVLSFIVIIGITNAINLVDGVDGLAGTIVCLICLFLGFTFFYWGNEFYKSYSTVAFCLFGGMAGFLRYNFYKAIIFMGDTGSLVSGFIVSVLAIQFIEMNSFSYSPVLALAILFIPVMDTLRVFLLRILKGVSPFTPDKNHLHHRLITLGLNQISTVSFLFIINLLAVILVLYFRDYNNNILTFLLVGYALIISCTIEILYKRRLG